MLDSKTRVLLRNVNDKTKEVWLMLPFDEDDLANALKSIGVEMCDAADSFDLLLAGDTIPGYEVIDNESDVLSPEDFSDLNEANDFVIRVEDLEPYQLDTLEALIENGDSIERALDELEKGDVDFYPHTTFAELAEQFAYEEMFTKEYLLEHIDFEAIGRDLSNQGYVEANGGILRRD